MTTLVITNDFGPRIGGIETFNAAVCDWLGEVIVLTARQPGSAAHDAELAYPVERIPGPRLSGGGRCRQPTLLPGRAVAGAAAELIRRRAIERVVISAAAPLGLLAPALRRAGARRIVALSHGHEAWWARLPGTRHALRRIVAGVDAFGVISSWTREAIAAVLPPAGRAKVIMVPPPVAPEFFAIDRRPATTVRCLAAGRFVAQKGFGTLLDAWRLLGDHAPPLTIAGSGPLDHRLRRRAGERVAFAGAVDRGRMPALLAEHDLFLAPVRRAAAGLVQEGFGLALAEAAAAGMAVIGTRTGGVPDIVEHGRTGWLVEPGDPRALARMIPEVCSAPDALIAAGHRGRTHARRFDGAAQRQELFGALAG
ncbi:phosphatidylinositol alpha-1,6-mannosyltransferase [Naumannella cuiyingiana]|uniref:Phosphatidylinositol alpha-1,6-mannosyltransferase n=1 Tax=Naumannella cuiyingiana TaxID=1347891 RepID=A0A7Z0IM02_9ACTN|nr:phosphatidylinositol alpha-1,6-mannosyltransferase [Naumannella cuiyingiana]